MALNLEDGSVDWRFGGLDVFHTLFTGTAVVGETLYAGSCIKPEQNDWYDHYLYAIRGD